MPAVLRLWTELANRSVIFGAIVMAMVHQEVRTFDLKPVSGSRAGLLGRKGIQPLDGDGYPPLNPRHGLRKIPAPFRHQPFGPHPKGITLSGSELSAMGIPVWGLSTWFPGAAVAAIRSTSR